MSPSTSTSPRRAAAASSKKRKRSLEREPSRSKTTTPPDPTRPNPPPPPPPALVKLLQGNKSALQYFQALQANLDFDVQKWKTRARAREKESQELKAQIQEWKAKHQTVLKDMEELEKSKKISDTSRKVDTPTRGREIQDDDFELDLSSNSSHPAAEAAKPLTNSHVLDTDWILESSDDDDSQPNGTNSLSSPPKSRPVAAFGIHKHNTSLIMSSSDDESDADMDPAMKFSQDIPEKTRKEGDRQDFLSPLQIVALRQLSRADDLLKVIGVLLVDEIQPDLEPKEVDHFQRVQDKEQEGDVDVELEAGDSNPEHGSIELRRRSDENVIHDLLQTIKALARINHEFDGFQYYPFQTSRAIPCYVPGRDATDTTHPPHPAVRGLGAVLRALCLMDAFCPAVKGDIPETNEIDERARRLWIGMQGRAGMISNFVESLRGEITGFWAFQDRTTRLSMTAYHLLEEPRQEKQATEKETRPTMDPVEKEKEWIPHSTTSHMRLASLVERCILAQIVTTVYLFRQDKTKALHFLLHYIQSSLPALSMEDHPKLPPVMSFCVIDAILNSQVPIVSEGDWADQVPVPKCQESSWLNDIDISVDLTKTLSTIFEFTARIQRQRNVPGLLSRIRDVARVELAAFEGLNECCATLVPSTKASDLMDPEDLVSILWEHVQKEASKDSYRKQSEQLLIALQLALTLNGNASTTDSLLDEAISQVKMLQEDEIPVARHSLLAFVALIGSKRGLEIRNQDEYRRIVHLPSIFGPWHTGSKSVHSHTHELTDWMVKQRFEAAACEVAFNVLLACDVVGDGTSVFRICRWIQRSEPSNDPDQSYRKLWKYIESVSNQCTVRVINLKRRPDRMASFVSQILQEQVYFVRGVSQLTGWNDATGSHESNTPKLGDFAIDGKGKPALVERQLMDLVGGPERLNSFVDTHWIPSDLKPFDTEAPTGSERTVLHPTEKACALSHISTWMGITSASKIAQNSVPLSTLGAQLLAGGTARGPAMNPENKDMDPQQVFIVLEDDAVLVDRFAQRLDLLLAELPRDFHFCSLGYSRPKTAPLIPFSSQISIPTAIWYLTGYLVSAAGAEYLLNRLPVRGPIDSWIGLTMFSCWDNVYGHSRGVGVSASMSTITAVPKETLRTFLRFRAFAATVPLCSQRVGGVTGASQNRFKKGRSWRQRDTDIIYSGSN